LKFWSVPSGQLLKGWRDSEGTVNCLALSPQGKRLASGGRGYIKIWSLESATRGKLIRKIIEESGNAIMEIAYGAGGSLVACITNVLDWDVRIYKTDTGALFKSIQPFSLNTQAIAASPDGNYLAAGHEEVAVYNFSQGTLIKRFRVFGSSSSDSVDTLAFTGDNKYLIIGSYQGKLKIYNFRTGQIVRCFMDLASNSKDKLGVTYKYKDAQGNTVEVTVPSCQCSPLPQGATCICNTVKGSYCSCAGQCSCHGVHIYWYPN
jgi:WD40 repeat protein